MMTRSLIVLCCCMLGVLADEKYTSKYDGIDIQEIMDNDRLFDAYANCIMERGKCTPEGTELKSHVKEALENECGKCTDVQKDGVTKLIQFIIEHKKKLWGELTEKYDPTGKYRKIYEDRAREKGIVIPQD